MSGEPIWVNSAAAALMLVGSVPEPARHIFGRPGDGLLVTACEKALP